MENSPSSVSGESRKRGVDIAAPDEIRFAVKTVRGDRLLDRENRRQRFVFDDHLLRRRATNLLRFADNEGNDLSVIRTPPCPRAEFRHDEPRRYR